MTVVERIKTTLPENDHPYRNGAWTPNFEEMVADDMEVIGTIPNDIDGLYVRNTENPVHDSIGRYHPFDGDGMIHTIRIRDGKAVYRNRFVRTTGFEAEQEEGGPLWVGIMGRPSDSKRRPGWGAHGSVKDSSSTDVVVHAGTILSTFYQCGEGYRLDPETLETLGTEKWVPEDGISAHPKVDEKTGELLFFNYSTKAPFLHYGVVGADNELKHYIPVELPGARLPHDMAFSENYAIFNDCPMYYANVKHRKGEEDFFPAQVFSKAGEWLEENAHKGQFFLQVESFDVHEPFHVPAPYDTMYTDGIPGGPDDYNIWPPYQIYADQDAFFDQTSPEELAYLKAQYYGKTTMVDKWVGAFFDKLSALDLWKDTMVVFTTDHGHDLGQRQCFGKQYPHYDSHANIPLIVWHPEHEGQGRRVDALVQNVDLFATLIEAAGGTPPEATRHSRSFLSTITDDAPSRDALTYGTFGQGICITDGEWTLFKSPIEGKPLYTYSTMINTPLIVDNPVDGRVSYDRRCWKNALSSALDSSARRPVMGVTRWLSRASSVSV